MARDLGVNPGTLGNWVAQHRAASGGGGALSGDERARLRQLERENAELRMERDVLKRSVVLWVKEAAKDADRAEPTHSMPSISPRPRSRKPSTQRSMPYMRESRQSR